MSADGELVLSANTSQLPDFMRDEAPDAGRITNEEGLFQVPYLKILQGLSDQVGQRLGTVGDVWSGAHEKVIGGPGKPVFLIPVNVKRSWTKFDGKKLLWSTDDPNDSRIAAEGDAAFKLSRLHVMVLAPVKPDWHDCKPVVISFGGTSHKAGANWYKLFTNQGAVKFNAPFYGQVWSFGVESAKNDKGEWWKPKIDFAGLVQSKDVFLACKEMYDHFTQQRWSSSEDSE